MRSLPTFLIAIVSFALGGLAGHFLLRGGGAAAKPPAAIAKSASAGGPPVVAKAPPPSTPAFTAPVVAGMQYQGMEFDTAPDFKHPATTFPAGGKIYFRIKFNDERQAKNGRKKSVGISYRRIGKSADQNGPVRQLMDDDLKSLGKPGEEAAFRQGLTFMSNPPAGATTFEVYVNIEPVGRASFTVTGATAAAATPQGTKPASKPAGTP